MVKRLFKNKFFVSIATLMSGSLIAQAISVLISPVMTRLYTEEQIGEYTLLLTAVTMFGAVICGKYDMSIVSEEKERNVFALIKLSLVIALVLSVLVGIGYSVYFCVTNSLQMSFISMFIWIFVLLMLNGIGHTLTSYNNRNKEYKLMASVHVIAEVGKATALISLGLLQLGRIGLLIAYLVSVALGLNRKAKRLRNHIDELKEVKAKELLAVAIKHKRQPLYSLPAGFASSFAYSSLNLFVNQLFGTVSLAYYSMSFRMLGLPLSLVSMNVAKPFFEKAAREYDREGRFSRTFIQTSLFLAAIAVPMVIVMFSLAPWAFELFFGEGWGISGQYVRYLAPMFGIRLVVGTLTPTMIIANKQNWELLFQICFVSCSVLSSIFFCNTIETFLIAVSVLFSIVYIIYYLTMLRLSFKKRGNEND